MKKDKFYIKYCNICNSIGRGRIFQVNCNILAKNEKFYVVKCKKCRLVYTNPKPKKLNLYYPQAYYSFSELEKSKGLFSKIVKHIREYFIDIYFNFNKFNIIKNIIGLILRQRLGGWTI